MRNTRSVLVHLAALALLGSTMSAAAAPVLDLGKSLRAASKPQPVNQPSTKPASGKPWARKKKKGGGK